MRFRTIIAAAVPAATVHGRVTTSDGQAITQPVVVVEKDGKPYAWTLGRAGIYKLVLPVGDYSLYATARHYTHSAPAAVTLAAGVMAWVSVRARPASSAPSSANSFDFSL